jgi:hypothetical protein
MFHAPPNKTGITAARAYSYFDGGASDIDLNSSTETMVNRLVRFKSQFPPLS